MEQQGVAKLRWQASLAIESIDSADELGDLGGIGCGDLVHRLEQAGKVDLALGESGQYLVDVQHQASRFSALARTTETLSREPRDRVRSTKF